jgi:hypothetical protein
MAERPSIPSALAIAKIGRRARKVGLCRWDDLTAASPRAAKRPRPRRFLQPEKAAFCEAADPVMHSAGTVAKELRALEQLRSAVTRRMSSRRWPARDSFDLMISFYTGSRTMSGSLNSSLSRARSVPGPLIAETEPVRTYPRRSREL